MTGKWIADKRNLIITGPCGVGKTWLACAVTQAACRNGITALYKRLPRLFGELELAHGTSQRCLASPAGQGTGGSPGCSAA